MLTQKQIESKFFTAMQKYSQYTDADTMQGVSISGGNSKMGTIKSVSLPHVISCPSGVPCAKMCYNNGTVFRDPVARAYMRNWAIWKNDPVQYWREVNTAVSMERFFRFHVSGDIPTPEYFAEMVKCAENNPHCEILVFTKNYDAVNSYLFTADIPKNLHVLFSEIDGWKMVNPFKFPVIKIANGLSAVPSDGKLCGGNCTECICKGVGCWQLQKGETLYILLHYTQSKAEALGR